MKRLSFFLSLIVTAALGSVFVASAQDPQEAPPAAPMGADEGDEAPDAAPTDEAPTDEAPTDEPAMDEPAMDEPAMDEPAMDEPSDDPPMDDEPSDDPAMDEPAEGGDAAPDEAPTDAAPDEAPEAEAQPAPAPVKKKSSALSSLSVEEGNAQLERTAKQEGAEPRRATLAEGQVAGLTTRDTALLDAESSGVAKFGGCEVTLSENTTFKVLEVGAETSIVEILGIELELDRGTILEAAFGSLSLKVKTGSLTARNTGGTSQVIQMSFVLPNGNTKTVTVTVPAQASGAAAPAISMDASGNITAGTVPLTLVTTEVSPTGDPVGEPSTSTVEAGGSVAAAPAGTTNVQIIAADAVVTETTADGPPAGTTPGTVGASLGIPGQ